MRKQEFIDALRAGLRGLPARDVEERVGFYDEMIDDRIEEGMPEQEAVAAAGDVDAIVSQIWSEIPLARLVKERIGEKRPLGTWPTVLLWVGAPVWLPLLIAVFAVLLSLYVSVWAVVISLWSAFASFCGGALGGVAAGVILIFTSNAATGLAGIAAGLVLAGLAVYGFYGCLALTKCVCALTPKILTGVKRCFVRGGVRNA